MSLFSMPNEILWVIMLAVNFGFIILLYRLFGRLGLFMWVPISAIVANIQVLKTVELFGLTTTLGNIVYASSFLVTDILSENYNEKDARRAVVLGFISLISITLLMNIALWFTPEASDFAQDSLNTLFGFFPRVVGASLIAYLLSQLHDIWSYNMWKSKLPQTKYIWIRNNASTMISQLIDTTVFTFIAFWGVYPINVFWQIFLTTYLFKWIVAALDTPLVYLSSYWKRTGIIKEV